MKRSIGAGLSVLRYCAKFLYFVLVNDDVDSYIYSRFFEIVIKRSITMQKIIENKRGR